MTSIVRFIAAAAIALTALASNAHSHLTSSTPADGAALKTAPAALALEFSEPVTLTAVTVGAEGRDKRSLSLPAKAAKTFNPPFAGLAAGRYVVA
jgi:methionine-rich copper-binding protein CopC